MLVLHQAAQGFMVCALTGSDGTRPLNHKKKEVKEYVAALRSISVTGQYPEMPQKALDSFMNLYRKVKSRQMMRQFTTSREFLAPSVDFDRSVCMLNDLRNEFQHFTPGKWSIEVAVFVDPARAAFELIKFLAFDSQNIVWRKYDQEEELRAGAEQLGERGLVLVTDVEEVTCLKSG